MYLCMSDVVLYIHDMHESWCASAANAPEISNIAQKKHVQHDHMRTRCDSWVSYNSMELPLSPSARRAFGKGPSSFMNSASMSYSLPPPYSGATARALCRGPLLCCLRPATHALCEHSVCGAMFSCAIASMSSAWHCMMLQQLQQHIVQLLSWC